MLTIKSRGEAVRYSAITSCKSAIAENGTLVHFVVLDSSTMRNSFEEVIQAEHWQDAMPTNALLISGHQKPLISSKPWPTAPMARKN